ncbi:hypothetical protein HPB51_014173 [Rhipicephalus microplus]|uniref:Uncharacterized protein n=1 Tax=Rhipicephalus microplus TaxID=6941 RepID=A0A9J6E1Q9_RHIMP|nr:hypothetical protein HPB51_014173 [Rhipicephalus microplus]
MRMNFRSGKSKIAVAAVAACILLLAVIGVLAFIGAESNVKEILCTVGHSAVTPNMYPPEFPCDYLYYTSVVILKKEVMATEVQTSWTTFQAMAKNYTRLISGMSFDYRYFSHHQLQPAIPALNALAQARIESYGILNIVASPEDLRTAVYKMRQDTEALAEYEPREEERHCARIHGLQR